MTNTLQPAERPQIARRDVPDVAFPSDNEFGIPLLSLRLQARFPDLPFMAYGSQGRSRQMPGTYHFYTGDYRFRALFDDPSPVVNSGCVNVVEPNFTTSDNMPPYEALNLIGRKRWLARYWQSFGIRVLVDLNVSPSYLEYNLIGVPVGWKAYATRGYSDRLEHTRREYEAACQRAQSDEILFVVYGGGAAVSEAALEQGWWWLPERADVVKGKFADG